MMEHHHPLSNHFYQIGRFRPMLVHCPIPCNGALPCLKICDCGKRRMRHRKNHACKKMSVAVGRQLWSNHDLDLPGKIISLNLEYLN